ncbi:hypothetical protein NM208_g16043 [Fusarium decemcellulare]|uniref:Uncharacterized protein n=1 Tax=Fusarium decemcellulare TaxID=57161 RepID=A0ACC1RD41_9HYPO|nr:hypothetical protein NM208_g16043 [Fusarium decemcellulare]
MSDRQTQPYELKALEKGRRPLPQHRGDRPPIPTAAGTDGHSLVQTQQAPPFPPALPAASHAADGSPEDLKSSSGSGSADTTPATDSAAAATTGNVNLPSPAMPSAVTGSGPLAPPAPIAPISAAGVPTAATRAAAASTTGYRYWTDAELRRLILLKRQDLPWEEIQSEFPGRTIEGLRQTFFKRRARVERLMDQEAAEQAASSGSTTTGAGPDGQPGQVVEAQQTDGGNQEVSGGQDGSGDQPSSGEQAPDNGEEMTEG